MTQAQLLSEFEVGIRTTFQKTLDILSYFRAADNIRSVKTSKRAHRKRAQKGPDRKADCELPKSASLFNAAMPSIFLGTIHAKG